VITTGLDDIVSLNANVSFLACRGCFFGFGPSTWKVRIRSDASLTEGVGRPLQERKTHGEYRNIAEAIFHAHIETEFSGLRHGQLEILDLTLWSLDVCECKEKCGFVLHEFGVWKVAEDQSMSQYHCRIPGFFVSSIAHSEVTFLL
jgi:hypothetical protein